MQDITWEHLQESLSQAAAHPMQTAWDIYRYLSEHYEQLGAESSRILLATYMKLPVERPSLLHSCILGVSVKMKAAFPSFRLPAFLQMWGFPQHLRPEDRQQQRGKDGRIYLSQQEKTIRCLADYLLHHPENRTPEHLGTIAPHCLITQAIAAKLFETEHNKRKLRSIQLITPDGTEYLVDSHLFPCKPWEIEGRLFDILIRPKATPAVTPPTNKSALNDAPAANSVTTVNSETTVNSAPAFAVKGVHPSSLSIESAFPTLTGYVDRIDASHGHIHIFDRYSRHMVASIATTKQHLSTIGVNIQSIAPGTYVRFSPIIPRHSKFKSAIIHRPLPPEEGRTTFPLRRAHITFIAPDRSYLAWQLDEAEPPVIEITRPDESTNEHAASPSQSATNAATRDTTRSGYLRTLGTSPAPIPPSFTPGIPLNIITFLKRGKDGQKHPYVAYYELANPITSTHRTCHPHHLNP